MVLEQILKLLPTIITILTVIFTYIYQRKRYRLIYTIPYFSDRLDDRIYLQKKFDYQFNEDEEVFGSVWLRLINYGNQPIKSSDFESPIIIKFDEETEITEVKYKNCYPTNLDLNITFNEKLIEIAPFLFNPKDSFDIDVSLNYIRHEINISSRIVNISEIEFKKEPLLSKFALSPLAIFSLIGLFISYTTSQFGNELDEFSFSISILILVFFIISTLLLGKLLRYYDKLFS